MKSQAKSQVKLWVKSPQICGARKANPHERYLHTEKPFRAQLRAMVCAVAAPFPPEVGAKARKVITQIGEPLVQAVRKVLKQAGGVPGYPPLIWLGS